MINTDIPILHSGYSKIRVGDNSYNVNFQEQNWVSIQRIKNSLCLLNDLILDETIPDFEIENYYYSPLFMQTTGNLSIGNLEVIKNNIWGRSVFVSDLGNLEYKESYDNLREIFFHDNSVFMRDNAGYALSNLRDERILPEFRNHFHSTNDLEDLLTFTNYLVKFEGSELAIDYLNEIKDIFLNLSKGKQILGEYDPMEGKPLDFDLECFISSLIWSTDEQIIKIIDDVRKSTDDLTGLCLHSRLKNSRGIQRELRRKTTDFIVETQDPLKEIADLGDIEF